MNKNIGKHIESRGKSPAFLDSSIPNPCFTATNSSGFLNPYLSKDLSGLLLTLRPPFLDTFQNHLLFLRFHGPALSSLHPCHSVQLLKIRLCKAKLLQTPLPAQIPVENTPGINCPVPGNPDTLMALSQHKYPSGLTSAG